MTNEHDDGVTDANVELQLWMVEIMTMAHMMRVNRTPDLMWIKQMAQTLSESIPPEYGKGLVDSVVEVRDCTYALCKACMWMWQEAEKLRVVAKSGDIIVERKVDGLTVEETPMDEEDGQ